MIRLLRYFLVASAAVWAQNVSPTINPSPAREFGQPALLPTLNSVAPNLVEGRELYQPFAVAFDTSASPPILYIADTSNNRILAYKNPANLSPCGLSNPTCGFADLVIGPRPGDFTTTLAGGPGNPSGVTAGLNFPTSIAVDSNGSLYVLDAGNNRILRFPAPFKQTGSLWNTDLVIGQKSVASGTQPLMGQPVPSAQSVFFSQGGTVFPASLTLDPSGNLWVTDPQDNRALRFPMSQLAANTTLPAADLVVGQSDFVTRAIAATPPGDYSSLQATSLFQPTGIAFDAKGRLYIADGSNSIGFSRVLFYTTPGFGSGMSASRILGLVFQLTSTPVTFPNNYALGSPNGLVTSGNNLFVCDSGNNRIVEYDIPENWPAQPTFVPNQTLGLQFSPNQQFSPPMLAVIGQTGFQTGSANKLQAKPDASTLFSPAGAAFSGTDLWVADTLNNRVLDFPQQSGAYVTATRLAGQLDYPYDSPNLIEGREVNFSGYEAGLAVDHRSGVTPHLYVADTFNNRILCFNDARNITGRADLVIGQTDFYSSLANSPLNDPTTASQTGFNLPADVLVDTAGNLWVADTGNGRVLRFPPPFDQPAGAQILPNLVLGQGGFAGTVITDPTQATMATPIGLAIFSDGGLAVSDAYDNRILIFKHAAGADFISSQAAGTVLGQQSFTSISSSIAASGFNSPRHIAVDTSDRLYVADAGNNRLMVFNGANTAGSGASSAIQLGGFNNPQGVKVSSITGEVWFADSNNHRIYRLPEYDTLIEDAGLPNFLNNATQIVLQTSPLTLELDDSDNVIVGELASRVTFFYAALAFQHAANFNSEPLAPGQLALLYRYGLNFNFTPTAAPTLPLPPSLGDVQILVNGVPAPMYRLDTIDVAFQVPSGTTPSGSANFVMLHPSTGEIIGTASIPMQPYSPGFFTLGVGGNGLAAATNLQDYSTNGPGNGAARGQSISFYLTGGGAFPGVPDGNTTSTPVVTTAMPQIVAAAFGGMIPATDIAYSGSSFFPGVWQINMLVDNTFAPNVDQVILVLMNGVPSNVGPSGQPASLSVYFIAK